MPRMGNLHPRHWAALRDSVSSPDLEFDDFRSSDPVVVSLGAAALRRVTARLHPRRVEVWTDPGFDLGQRAVYYVRVLEIPTPRWTTYDAVRNDLPLPEDVPATIQERAWSWPIWYTPAESKK